MAEKIKVVHVLNSLAPSGVEKVVVNICNQLDREVFKPIVVTLTNNDMSLQSELKPDVEVHVLPYPYKEKPNIFLLCQQYRSLLKLLKEIHADIVHTHTYVFRLLVAAKAAKKSGAKLIKTAHLAGIHLQHKGFGNRLKIAVERYAFRQSNNSYLTAVSDVVDKSNRHFFSKQVKNFRTIYNGIDPDKFSKHNHHLTKEDFGYKQNSIVVVHVGRLSLEKDHFTIINAWKILAESNSLNNRDINLIIIGDGRERANIENQIRSLGLSKSVKLTGNVDNVSDYLSISDIAILPSLEEGLPLVMLEQMQMCLPVIVSDIDVFKSIVTPNVNAVMVPKQNPQALSDAIIDLANNEGKRKTLGLAGYKLVEQKYTFKKMIEGYEACYLEMINGQL